MQLTADATVLEGVVGGEGRSNRLEYLDRKVLFGVLSATADCYASAKKTCARACRNRTEQPFWAPRAGGHQRDIHEARCNLHSDGNMHAARLSVSEHKLILQHPQGMMLLKMQLVQKA